MTRQSLMSAVCALWLAVPASADTQLTIATVSNPDMERLKRHAEAFTAAHPDIALDWVMLDENTLRHHVATDIATRAGRFDVVTIGTFEAPIWAERGWLAPLDGFPAEYDLADILPPIREALSHDGTLYAAPFYAESSITMYRTDLFEQAGLNMPEAPSWDFIQTAAATLDAQNDTVNGICLRGKPGWGENVALISAMAASYGARWFDMGWTPQLDSPAWAEAVTDYVTLLADHGPEDATAYGYADTLALFQQGKCAIWIDATVAASAVTDPETSTVADHVGFARAPDHGLGRASNWLWAWALAVPAGSAQSAAAKRFVAWATSPEYTAQVAQQDGWAQVPPGTRASLYDTPAYRAAAPFAEITRQSIETANPDRPALDEVPYRGIQYVAIPEFPGIGTAVGTQFAKALDGQISIQDALRNAQWVTDKVAQRARFLQDE